MFWCLDTDHQGYSMDMHAVVNEASWFLNSICYARHERLFIYSWYLLYGHTLRQTSNNQHAGSIFSSYSGQGNMKDGQARMQVIQ